MAQQLLDWLSSESLWLPPDTTWADLERTPTFFTPRLADLQWSIVFAVVFILARLVWERVIARPIGRMYNLKETTSYPATPNPILEEQYQKQTRLPAHATIEALSKRVDWTPRQVERWWRRRRQQDKPSQMLRFLETSWRAVAYWFLLFYGVIALWDKPWTWDYTQIFDTYPFQAVTSDIYWYYMLEMGFYISLSLSLCMDNKRKDFAEMVTHHISTIILITLSWIVNVVRVGTMTLLIHDAVDPWMETAKLCVYTKNQKSADVLFVIFTIVWFITRVGIFPFKILRVCFGTYYKRAWGVPGMTLLVALLLVLQVLHLIWTYVIVRMLFSYVLKGKVEKDARSETDLDEDDEKDVANGTELLHKKEMNGNASEEPTDTCNGVS